MGSTPSTHTTPPLPSPPTTLYFAYGSNLSLTQMAHRCPSSPYLGVAILHNYRWIINARGYANVVPSPRDVVYGLTYALTAEDEARLDVNEGVPWAYVKRMMDVEVWAEGRMVVEGEEGTVRKGLVYVDERRVGEGAPREEYVGRMNRGIEEAVEKGLPVGFQQGNESRARRDQETPLLGRFRALPAEAGRQRRGSSEGRWFASFRRITSYDYGTTNNGGDTEAQEDIQDGGHWDYLRRLLLSPEPDVIRRAIEHWWGRAFLLFVLPALITIVFCAIPLPSYPLFSDPPESSPPRQTDDRVPGKGEALVKLNFWFFLFVYYGFYNCVALLWITKLFHIYNMNWWPTVIGLPGTLLALVLVLVLIPIPIYFNPASQWLVGHNTSWVFLTVLTMLVPVIVAFGKLLKSERYLGLQQHISDTQKLLTSDTWIGGTDHGAASTRQRAVAEASGFNPHSIVSLQAADAAGERSRSLRRRWIPASFVRFTWFCLAMFLGLLAYALGEAYAEIYLRTLPHNSIETVIYVYSWVITIHVLDGLVGWILGGEDGERVGSYPLGWVFKLLRHPPTQTCQNPSLTRRRYFMLTYQTYVRALYARLRSPSQFAILQILSSSLLILITPLSLTPLCHKTLVLLALNGQDYNVYKTFASRNIFLRGVAENASMLAFLGEILVLNYGPNKLIYPYLSFSDPDDPYTFPLTFWASCVTWACEIVAGWIVRRILAVTFKMDVTRDGRADLVKWPELLPTSLAVMVHVLQNMLFSIIRLRFR